MRENLFHLIAPFTKPRIFPAHKPRLQPESVRFFRGESLSPAIKKPFYSEITLNLLDNNVFQELDREFRDCVITPPFCNEITLNLFHNNGHPWNHLQDAERTQDDLIIANDLFAPLPKAKLLSPEQLGSTIFSEELSISDDLFVPLKKVLLKGRQYVTEEEKNSEADLFVQSGNSRKSDYDAEKREQQSEVDAVVTKTPKRELDFFELILPVLLPPLTFTKDEIPLLPYPLYQFQEVGIEQLINHPHFLLADEMGTGKTVMTCVALKILFQKGKVTNGIIVSPVSVLRVWQNHLREWVPELRIRLIRGNQAEREILWQHPAHIYLVSYDTLRSDVSENRLPGGRHPKIDLVVLDEAQAIKSPSSKRNQAVRKIKAKYRWALTGTPLENRIEDVCTIFNFLIPNLFPQEELKSIGEEDIRRRIEPNMLRRLKRDVLKDLPPKIRQEVWLELDEEQEREYKAILQHERQSLINKGGEISKIHIFSSIQRLKIICNFASNRINSPKAQALLDIMEEIDGSDTKLLVFSQYVEHGIDKLEKAFSKRKDIGKFTGQMTAQKRERQIENFRKNPEQKILLISVKAGGTGLTLTEASYVVHFDQWWNPAVSRQAEDRAHRKGQQASSVNIYEFWMANTIEERIHKLLHKKGAVCQELCKISGWFSAFAGTEMLRSFTLRVTA